MSLTKIVTGASNRVRQIGKRAIPYVLAASVFFGSLGPSFPALAENNRKAESPKPTTTIEQVSENLPFEETPITKDKRPIPANNAIIKQKTQQQKTLEQKLGAEKQQQKTAKPETKTGCVDVVVEKGDSVWGIVKGLYHSKEKIRNSYKNIADAVKRVIAYNKINPKKLMPGQMLKIPYRLKQYTKKIAAKTAARIKEVRAAAKKLLPTTDEKEELAARLHKHGFELKGNKVEYTVQGGNTLAEISDMYKKATGKRVHPWQIASYNKINNPDKIFPKQQILIPTRQQDFKQLEERAKQFWQQKKERAKQIYAKILAQRKHQPAYQQSYTTQKAKPASISDLVKHQKPASSYGLTGAYQDYFNRIMQMAQNKDYIKALDALSKLYETAKNTGHVLANDWDVKFRLVAGSEEYKEIKFDPNKVIEELAERALKLMQRTKLKPQYLPKLQYK